MEPLEAILKELVGDMPKPDERGMYCHVVVKEEKGPDGKTRRETTPIDDAKIERAIVQIHKHGPKAIVGLIDMIVEPLEGNDAQPVQAKYALHCLGLYVLKQPSTKARREFAETLAREIGGNRPKGVQKYLVEELQAFGGKEVVNALSKLLADEDLCDPAAAALLVIGGDAAKRLREAVGNAKGRCRLILLQNLGVIGDPEAVGALKQALGDEDREVRLAAAWGLANVGDAASADLIRKAADGSSDWERIQMTKACLMLAENLLAKGMKNEAVGIYEHLRDTRKDASERYVCEAATAALAAAK